MRPGATPEAVAERDWVVYLLGTDLVLAPSAAAPVPAGPVTHDQLVALSFAADLVVTW
ncbi:MAG: hypothetical protein ABI175_00530 [Polyangiales bacterium]